MFHKGLSDINPVDYFMGLHEFMKVFCDDMLKLFRQGSKTSPGYQKPLFVYLVIGCRAACIFFHDFLESDLHVVSLYAVFLAGKAKKRGKGPLLFLMHKTGRYLSKGILLRILPGLFCRDDPFCPTAADKLIGSASCDIPCGIQTLQGRLSIDIYPITRLGMATYNVRLGGLDFNRFL